MKPTRRTFLKGAGAAVGTGAVLTAVPMATTRTAAEAATWPPPSSDLLFRQADLTTTASLEAAGCRRDSLATAGYTSGARAKAAVVPGGAAGELQFPGANAALLVPIAGSLPRDEWTVRFTVTNKSGSDFAAIPYSAGQIFFLANAIMVYRSGTNKVSVTNFWTGQGGTFTIGSGTWANNASKTFTMWWRRSTNTFEVMIDSDYSGRIVGGTPLSAAPPVGYPPNGRDEGIQLGGTTGSSFPFTIKDTEIHRWFWPYTGTSPTDPGPTVSVDASSASGAWADGLSGILALYEGFWETPETSYTAIRDGQFAWAFDQTETKSVRFAGLMNLVGITETSPGIFSYDWTYVDAKLDRMLSTRPNLTLHVSLDYTPTLLQPSGGSNISPPTNITKWATIASDVVGHLKTRYGSQFTSCTLWNEPDLGQYWSGTQTQLYNLWAATQTKLLATHPDKAMGSPEFAHLPGIQNFFTWLSGQSATLRGSLTGVYGHCFLQNLYEVRNQVAKMRQSATAAGVATSVPIRLTEYSLKLTQIGERHDDATSWFGTQPNHFTTEYASAFVLPFLWEALAADDVDLVSFGAIGTNLLYWDIEAMVTAASAGLPVEPYPANSAIELVAKLSGGRISANSNWPSTTALATKTSAGVITVAYANFKPFQGYVADTSFAVSWSGLPSTYTWKQWRLDRTTLPTNKALAQIATGNQTNLPTSVTLGNLGIGAIQITP